MRKILSIVLVFVTVSILTISLSITASATSSGTCGANLTWVLDDSGTLTISGEGGMYNVSHFENEPKQTWYSSRLLIKSVVIANGVTSIGDAAFHHCNNLTNVTIPDSVTSIGDFAFDYCRSLSSITIPNGVKSIGDGAFSYSGLTDIILADSVESIGNDTFESCNSLNSISIPNSVMNIAYDAFAGCSSLTSIAVESDNPNYFSDEYGVLYNKDKTEIIQYPAGNTRTSFAIPETVTRIDNEAFRICDYLTSITIPDSVTSIGEGAFYGCGIKSITIGENVTSIEDYTFMNCTALTSVTIPDSVKSIGDGAFDWCISLTNITIGDGVTSIGDCAFFSCSSLTSITIPSSVTNIVNNPFDGCSSLTSITVENDNPNYCNDEYGVLYNKNKTIIMQYPAGNTRASFVLPRSVENVYISAFDGSSLISITVESGNQNYCSDEYGVLYNKDKTEIIRYTGGNKCTSFDIPKTVTEIGSHAFNSCYNLTSVTVPNGVTTIGYEAFDFCINLTDVYYSGSKEEWDKIDIRNFNESLTEATIHYNYLSIIEKFSDAVNKNGMSDEVSKFKIDSTYPADKANDVPATFDLRLYFNKSIKSANANKKVKVMKANGDVYKTMNADEGNINGNTITFPNISLPQGYTYSVIIDNGAYTSDFGDVFYGLQKGTFSFVVPPASDNHKVNLDYPGKYVFGLFGSNTDVPPIPKGSVSNYAEELQDWATAYNINSIAAYESPEKLLEIPVKNPVTDTRGQTFLLNDGGTTVKQVMDDLIFIESLKPYVAKMNAELENVKSTEASENLLGYDDEKALYNNKIVPYAEQISEYLDRRNEKSSFFLSVATPLAYTSLLKSATSTLGENESIFVKAIADASIDSIALEEELSSITSTKDYETFKSNLSDIKTFSSAGKELYKIKTSGFSSSTAKLAIDLFDKYYTGENETVKMISDARSSMGDVISCTKMSAFLGTSLGFMPMVVELNENLQKSLSDKIKAWFFIGDYYIKDKYPNIYNYYFTDGGYEINEDFISMEWENTSSTSDIGAAAAREYQQCKNENDAIAVSWCDFADRTGVVKIRASELLGVKRDIVNLGTIMKFVDTVDIEETKRCLLDYISATINKSKTSEFYGMCPIVVDVYDKDNNLLATLSSENEEDIESEYGSFYILGDNNEAKYFIATSDEYRVEISAYDEGTMSVATIERDELGNVVNTSYFKDISLTTNSKFSLISTPDESVLTNLETEAVEDESVNSPENIQLSCITNEIAIGRALEIKADIFPDFSQYDSVEWQIFDENNNDTSWATIENGIFLASEEGTYIIRATVNENVYDEIIIDAYCPITQILCEYETLTMMTGEEKQIDIETNADASSNRVVKKYSDKENVVTIAEDGTLTAVGQGEATIKYFSDGVEFLLPVIVYDAPIEISLYQSDTDGMRFKIDAINTSCQNSFVGTLTVNVFKDDILLETDMIDLNLKSWEVLSDFVNFDYLTDAESEYDIETIVFDADGKTIYTAYDVIDGFDYIVKLNMDDGSIIEMSYAEFNEYVPAAKEGLVFMGWYPDNSFETSMRIDKLTADYGDTVELYGWWIKESELIAANIISSYEYDKLSVKLDFELSASDGIAYVEIFDYDEQGELKINQTSTKNISKDIEELNFDIPFVGDDQNHLLKISFYDNIGAKNPIGNTVETEFFAESQPCYKDGIFYYVTDNDTIEIVGCDSAENYVEIPYFIDEYKVTKISDSAFEDAEFQTILIPVSITQIGRDIFGKCEELEEIKYTGTEEQWNEISIDEENSVLNKTYKTFNAYTAVVFAEIDNISYESEVLALNIIFSSAKTDFTIHILVDDGDGIDKHELLEKEIGRNSESLEINIPFIPDNKSHNLYIQYELDGNMYMDEEVYWSFYAEKTFEGEEYDGVYYIFLDDETAQVEGTDSDYIEIPPIVDGHRVISIAENAFYNSDIRSVLLPITLENIGKNAFYDCSDLETINYAGSSKSWEEVVIEEGNTVISKSIKYDYPDSIWMDWGWHQFNVDKWEIPLTFYRMYRECSLLVQIYEYDINTDSLTEKIYEEYHDIPLGVTDYQVSIPFPADNKRYSIVPTLVDKNDHNVILVEYNGNGFLTAEREIFQEDGWKYYCYDGISEIAGYDGEIAEILTIPAELGGCPVTKIAEWALYIPPEMAPDLEKLVIPSTVTHIGREAFGMMPIKEAVIPASVCEFGQSPFVGCDNLTNIIIDEANGYYTSIDGNLYTKDKKKLVQYAPGNCSSEIVISEGTEIIGEGAFAMNEKIEKVKLPFSIKELEPYAFTYCSNLKDIEVADTSDITKIGKGAFQGTAFEKFEIPASVTFIGEGAFDGCDNLTSIEVESDNNVYCSVNGNLYSKDKKTFVLYANGKQDTYFEVPDEVIEIVNGAFNSGSIERIYMPKSVTTIGVNAFGYNMQGGIICYEGSQEEWDDFIDYDNAGMFVLNAEKIFDFNKTATVKGNLLDCYYDNGYVTAHVNMTYVFEDCVAILVVYDEDERLVSMTSVDVSKESQYIDIPCKVNEDCEDYIAKVFFWKNLASIKPLAEPIIANITEPKLELVSPYEEGVIYKFYQYNEECESISLTFSENTVIGDNNVLEIFGLNDEFVGQYYSGDLSGQTITVPGNKVKIAFWAGQDDGNGYKVTNIVINK